MSRCVLALSGLLLAGTVSAQQSPNYVLSDFTFGTAGRVDLSSPDYRITLALAGAPTAATGLMSPSHGADAGFIASYPPPGEVVGLTFADRQTLTWTAERSVGHYQLYRGLLGGLAVYGTCRTWPIPETTVIDLESPTARDGFFYLVTAENRLGEEGTKGANSAGVERPNLDPCP